MEDEQNSKLSFLHRNAWFRSTPFAGLSFVEASKTVIEIVFWYLLIGLFLVFTIVNVYDTIMRYNSHPTRTYVVLSSSTEDIHITNLTLHLQLSLSELLETAPAKYGNEYMMCRNSKVNSGVMDEKYAPIAIACLLANDEIDDSYVNNAMLFQQILGQRMPMTCDTSYERTTPDWLDLFENWLQPTTETSLSDYKIGDQNIWLQWTENDQNYWDIRQLLEDHAKDSYTDSWGRPTVDNDVITLFTETMKPKVGNRPAILMTLEALEYGIDPRLKLFSQLQQYANDLDPDLNREQKMKLKDSLIQNDTEAFSDNMQEFLEMHGLTAQDVLSLALEVVNDLIHIDAPGVDVVLHDWHYELVGWSRLPMQFTFELLLYNNTKNIDIAIYSHLVQKFEMIHAALRDELEHLRSTKPSYSYAMDFTYECSNVDKRSAVDLLHQYMYMSFFSQYEAQLNTMLTIEASQGSSITLNQPFSNYEIVIKPNGHFTAEIDTCFDGSPDHCKAECLDQFNVQECGCSPWHFYHLHENLGSFTVCQQPCASAEPRRKECREECERFLKHPCSLTNYELEQQSVTRDPLEYQGPMGAHPLYRVNIGVAVRILAVIRAIAELQERNFPLFVEEYSMPLSTLLSELGGHLDIWMGINVVGVIHLLVYVLKQMFHAGHPDTTTGRTIRRLFGMRITPGDAENDHKESLPEVTKVIHEHRIENLEKEILSIRDDIKELKNMLIQEAVKKA